MGAFKKTVPLILVFLILLPLSFAPTTFDCPGCTMSHVLLSLDKSSNTLEAIVIGFNQSYQKDMKEITSWEDSQGEIGETLNEAKYSAGNLNSLKEVYVKIYYTNKTTGEKKYIDCDQSTTDTIDHLYTDKSKEITNDATGETATIYYGTCTVPEKTYQGGCTVLFGEFSGADEISASQTSVGLMVCDPEGVTLFSKLIAALQTSIQKTMVNNEGICLLSMLLIGILFASMFFSGRSPLSLFDLASPKLPSPKSLAVSGSVKAPMAYGRMKSGIKETSKAIDTFFNKYTTGATVAGLAGAPAYLKALAHHAQEHGQTEDLTRILNSYSGGKVDLNEVRKILNDFKARGGVEKNLALMAELRIMGEDQMKQMAIFGGGTEKGKVSWLQDKATKFVKLTEQVPMIGSFLSTSLGNVFAGYQFTKRIGRATVSSIAHAVTPEKKIRQLIEEGKRKASAAGKEGEIAGFLPRLLAETDSSTIEIGRMYMVGHKMEKHYDDALREAYDDLDIYMLQRLFRQHGEVNSELVGITTLFSRFDQKMSEKLIALSRLIDAEHDPVKVARLRALEERLQTIFTARIAEGEAYENFRSKRLDNLVALAAELGVSFDVDGVRNARNTLNGISGSADSTELKWVRLTSYLTESAAVSPTDGNFYHLAGREALWYEDGSTDLISRNLFKAFLQNLERGALESSPGESLLLNSMKGNFVKMVNEYCGIQNWEHFSDKELQELMKVTYRYMDDLVSNRAALAAHDPAYLLPTKLEESLEPEAARELGKQDWKIDMNWIWYIGVDGKPMPEKLKEMTVADHVKGQFQRAYTEEYIPRFEDRARGIGITNREEKREVYLSGYLFDRMQLRLNEDAHNVYGSSFGNLRRFYTSVYAEMIRRYASIATDENGNPLYADLSRELRELSSEEVLQRARNLDPKFLEDLRAKFMERPVTYDVHKKGVWARTNEGGWIPINEEIPLSSMDIVLNGVSVYRDRNGNLRKFDPKLNYEAELAASGHSDLVQRIRSVSGSKSTGEWAPILSEVEALARTGGIHGGVVTSIAYNYAKTTGDWSGLQNVRGPDGQRVSMLVSKDEFLRASGGPVNWVKRQAWNLGYALERNLLNTFGSNALALDAVNQISTVYNTRYRELATNVQQGVGMAGLSDTLQKQLEDVARRQKKYQSAWDFTIDRHPSGSSTATGEMLWMESFYHHGPKMSFDPSTPGSHRDYYSRSQWSAMSINNMFINLGRRFLIGPISSYRTFKVASEGRPTKYEHTEDPMNRWRMRERSTSEAVRALINPLYGGLEMRRTREFIWRILPERVKERMDEDWRLGGEALRRKMHGPSTSYGGEDMGRATRPSKEDFALARENVAISAILGNANPASTYYDSRGRLQYDVSTAEQLVYRSAIGSSIPSSRLGLSGFYAGDAELSAQAHSNVVKRTVSPVLHNIERQSELTAHGGIGGHGFTRRIASILPFAALAYGLGHYALTGGPSRTKEKWKNRYEGVREAVTHPGETARQSWDSFKRYGGNMGYHHCIYCNAMKPRGSACSNPNCRSNLGRARP
ncbi:MAG: hypothetical protein PHU63_02330 [Candidatus ainarchaeum sp.]|nr:hypothetical protein [Candidatus ainarchaeum sp.]